MLAQCRRIRGIPLLGLVAVAAFATVWGVGMAVAASTVAPQNDPNQHALQQRSQQVDRGETALRVLHSHRPNLPIVTPPGAPNLPVPSSHYRQNLNRGSVAAARPASAYRPAACAARKRLAEGEGFEPPRRLRA